MTAQKTIVTAGLIAVLAIPAHAQMNHSDMHHGSMPLTNELSGAAESTLPTEPGQGAFAAISEIVAMLAADPETDWSKVKIDALRAHLVDMNNLVVKASVSTRNIDGGIEVTIAKVGPDEGAAMRMVPAHAPVLEGETGWLSEVEDRGDDFVWRVSSSRDEARIRALGFFGLMATGDHHRSHHLAMAKGHPMH